MSRKSNGSAVKRVVVVSEEELVMYRKALALLTEAQERQRAANDAVQQCIGATEFLQRQIAERYGLKDGDAFDLDTGRITFNAKGST